jgi:hypothetical protein
MRLPCKQQADAGHLGIGRQVPFDGLSLAETAYIPKGFFPVIIRRDQGFLDVRADDF